MSSRRRIQRQTSSINAVQCKRNGDHGDQSKRYSLRYDNNWNFEEFLEAASNAMDMYPPAQRAFDGFGTEITDVLMFGEAGTVVYLAFKKDEAFIPIPSATDMTAVGTKWGLPAMMGAFKVGSVLDYTKNTKYPRTVALMTNESTKEQCVCKFIPRSALDDMDVVNALGEEVRCLVSLNHPNIVCFKRREDLTTHVVLVLDPWFGCNMRTHLINNGPLSESQARTVIAQVTSALIHMHLKGITHGNICLEKIIMKMPDQLDHVIVTGFHRACSHKGGGAFQIPSVVDVGVPYTAPEGFGTSPVLAAPMDVWALGVVYFALLHDRFPFGGCALEADNTLLSVSALQATTFNIKTGMYTVDPHLSSACRLAIRSVFTLDARCRPDVSQALRLFEGTVHLLPPLMAPSDSVAPLLSLADEAGEKVDKEEGAAARSSDKSVKFPFMAPSVHSSGRSRSSDTDTSVGEGEDATPPGAEPSDTSPATPSSTVSPMPSATTQAEEYAQLIQKALGTLDRADCAARQGKKLAETRGWLADLDRPDRSGLRRSPWRRADLAGGSVGGAGEAGGAGVGVGVQGASVQSANVSVGSAHLPGLSSRSPSRASSSCRSSRSSSTRSSFASEVSASEKAPQSTADDAVFSALTIEDDDDDVEPIKPTRPRFKARQLVASGRNYLPEDMG